MVFSASRCLKGRDSQSAPPDLYTTALRLDSTGLKWQRPVCLRHPG